MSSISSIDTSLYAGLVESVGSFSHSRPQESQQVDHQEARAQISDVDLSNYYSNVSMHDLLTEVGENVAKSAEELDNAMASALENGFSINDAINIQNAKCAYEANCHVMKSTFELSI